MKRLWHWSAVAVVVAAGLACREGVFFGQEKKPGAAPAPAAPAGNAGAEAPPPESPPADEAAGDEPAAAAADPELIYVHLMDGSIIAGKLSMKNVEIETEFGTLKVPVSAIKSFMPGLESHPEVAENLDELIKDLGSGNFSRREAAQKALLK